MCEFRLLMESENKMKKQVIRSNKASNPRINNNRNQSSSTAASRISTVVFGRSLTQSLSFPSRTDLMKRSIEIYPSDSDLRHFQNNSSKVESRVSETSGRRRTNPVGKKPFPGVNSKSGAASLPSRTQSTVRILFHFIFYFPNFLLQYMFFI